VKSRRPIGLGVALSLLFSACATAVPPIGTSGQPFTPDADEQLLWTQADREAVVLRKRVKLYEDAALATYLTGLAGRLTPESVKAAGAPVPHVEVIRDPTLGAFALPNGRVFVHTGTVAAVESEAQLALILARELAHVFRRHALSAAREGLVTPVRADGVAPLGPTAAAIVAGGLQLTATAAMTGYGEGREREADVVGLSNVEGAGWNPDEATTVWTLLSRDLGARGAIETMLLASPAWLEARIQARDRPGDAAAAPSVASSGELEGVRRVVLRDTAGDDLRRGRFALARRELDRVLAAAPSDVSAQVLYGDLHRLQSQRAATPEERDTELRQARARYTRALALDPDLADAHRQLGLLSSQQQNLRRARTELEEYLRRAGGALDAARIAEYVRELGR
jgi:beta-barrel assembly-enhancing protease